MALNSQELADLRADLGDQNSPYAFSDDELQRIYERSDDDYARTLLLAIKQLLMNATKFYNYVSGHTRQEQEKIFAHLQAMYELQTGETIGKKQVFIVGLAQVPTAHKADPIPTGGNIGPGTGLPDARL